jgi:hypothetical protein
MKYPIDLGKKMESPMMAVTSEKSEEKELYYPSLYLDWDGKYDLPEEGEMTVKFKRRSVTNSERDGKKHQSVELEILSIEDASEEAMSKNDDRGDHMDMMAKKGRYSEEESD